MKNVILNRSNILDGTNNSKLQYNFPNTLEFKDDQVAVASIDIPFSWDNITGDLNNNVFYYAWNDGSGSAIYPVNIPDGGYYLTEDLNAVLQFQLLANGHYLVDASGNYVYYLAFTYNRVLLGVEIRCDPLPVALPSGWTNPAGVIVFPVSPITPQMIIPTTNFQTLVGFNPGGYPLVAQATTYNALAQNAPEFFTTSTIIMLCSLLNNKYSKPNTILYSFPAYSYLYGALIRIAVPDLVFTGIQDQFQQSFTIEFVNQDFKPINIRDPQMLIQLVFTKRTEALLK